MGKISIIDVAREAGVSTATVSRVINNLETVKPVTARHVRNVIARLGYVAKGHRKGHKAKPANMVPPPQRTVLFLWIDGPEGGAKTEAGHALQEGAAAGLRQLGMDMVVDYLAGDGVLPPVVESDRVDGILIHGSAKLSAANEAILRQYPAVWLFYQGSHKWGDRVEPDHRLAGELALEYLIDNGRRNLCTVTHMSSWETRRYDGERTDAFQRLARLRSIPCQILGEDLPYVNSQKELFEQARRIVDDFVSLSPRPDGMFIANELTSYIHEHLSRKGIVPMRDVLMVGGDREDTPRHLAPPPASIDVRAAEIGRLAVYVLANRLRLPDVPRIRQLVEPTLIVP